MPDPGPVELQRVDDVTWIIVDADVPSDDASRIIACIEEHDDAGVVVTWLRPIPLATRYLDVAMALEELVRWRVRPSTATRPTPIPHLMPPAA